MKNLRNSSKGFTLIEMIVVITLVGILMGIAFPQTMKFLAAGRDTERISNVSRVVPGYLELYFNQEGRYPTATDWDDLEGKLGDAEVLGNKPFPAPVRDRSYCYDAGDGFTYTLGVQLELDNKILKDSVRNVDCGGLPCGETGKLYCVQP